MKRYVALLRGINIGGKNKVSMAELKKGFEKLAFEEVKTYLNSGNVIFSSDEDDTKKFTNTKCGYPGGRNAYRVSPSPRFGLAR